MADVDDAALVRRVIEGDVEAFAVVVERYQRPIFRFVSNMALHADDVEDVAQDVFLSAYRNLHRFDSRKGRLATWLFAIARNRVINVAQKRRAEPEAGALDRAAAAGVSPSAELERRETFAALDAALAALPVAQRAVFVLAEIEGLSLAEVAEIEAVPVGTVKSRLSRAKEALRMALRHVHGVER